MIPIAEMLGGSDNLIWELIRSIAIIIAVAVAALSFYFSKLQGAKIKAVEVQEQAPLNAANHTIVFTNYGNKTGVIKGPELFTNDEKMKLSLEEEDEAVYAVEPHSTKIIKLEVKSNSDKNYKYHLEFENLKGRKIKLPEYVFLNEAE